MYLQPQLHKCEKSKLKLYAEVRGPKSNHLNNNISVDPDIRKSENNLLRHLQI